MDFNLQIKQEVNDLHWHSPPGFLMKYMPLSGKYPFQFSEKKLSIIIKTRFIIIFDLQYESNLDISVLFFFCRLFKGIAGDLRNMHNLALTKCDCTLMLLLFSK